MTRWTPAFIHTPLVDTGAQIAALETRLACLRDVEPVTECWSSPPTRLTELLAKSSPLSPADWAELTAFEREAS